MKIIIETKDKEIIERVSKYLKRNKINFSKEEEKENTNIKKSNETFEFRSFYNEEEFLKEVERFLNYKGITELKNLEKLKDKMNEDFLKVLPRYNYLYEFGEESPFNGNDDNLEELVDSLKSVMIDSEEYDEDEELQICCFNGGCSECPFDGILCT